MKIRKKISNKIKEIRKYFRRKKLKNKDFTIISNNCFAGAIYQYFGLPYNSPTIGLYFFANDYIKFLENLNYYLDLELKFIPLEKSKHYEELLKRKENVPIGLIGDVEIIFLHYESEEEALEKWERRKKRINREKMIVKFNDQNYATEKEIKRFCKLDYKNKLCFVANPILGINNTIVFKEYLGEKNIKGDFNEWKKYINIIKYLNNL